MAEVSITIRKNSAVGGTETVIIVSGTVEDSALAPFTDQLATLLAATAQANAPTPAPTPTPAV